MHTIRVETTIAASPSTCFDLARSVDAHVASADDTGERAVAGVTAGLLGPGDEVTWEGSHLGVVQRLSSRVTAFRPPAYFQDRMTRGTFRFLEHDHQFDPLDGERTRMVDVVRFAAPFGPIGWAAERLVLAGHLRRYLVRRGAALKRMAEGGTQP